MIFRDRLDAGRQLAVVLEEYRGGNGIVLALPRGGVVVGCEVAAALGLPLDVILTRKVGPPGNPEYAIGAVAENGEVVLNEAEVHAYGIPRSYIDSEVRRQHAEIERRTALYRNGRGLPPLAGRVAIVVDDGVATGYTTAAALAAARKEAPARLVLAVPIGPAETLSWLSTLADRVVFLASPEPFFAVGRFYDRFDQVSDDEVRALLAPTQSQERGAASGLDRLD